MKPTRRSILAALLSAPAVPAVMRKTKAEPEATKGPECHKCGAPMAWFTMRDGNYCDDVFSACSIDAAHNTAGNYLSAIRTGAARAVGWAP